MFIPYLANKEIDFYPQSWGGMAVSFQVYKMRLTFAIIIIIGFMNVGLSKGDEKPQPSPLCNGILLCDIPTPPTGFKAKGHDKPK